MLTLICLGIGAMWSDCSNFLSQWHCTDLCAIQGLSNSCLYSTCEQCKPASDSSLVDEWHHYSDAPIKCLSSGWYIVMLCPFSAAVSLQTEGTPPHPIPQRLRSEHSQDSSRNSCFLSNTESTAQLCSSGFVYLQSAWLPNHSWQVASATSKAAIFCWWWCLQLLGQQIASVPLTCPLPWDAAEALYFA